MLSKFILNIARHGLYASVSNLFARKTFLQMSANFFYDPPLVMVFVYVGWLGEARGNSYTKEVSRYILSARPRKYFRWSFVKSKEFFDEIHYFDKHIKAKCLVMIIIYSTILPALIFPMELTGSQCNIRYS